MVLLCHGYIDQPPPSDAGTIAVTGTASQVDASAGNGSTTVTQPADATAAVAFFSHFDNNGGTTLATLTLAGSNFTISEQLAEGATTDESGVGVAVIEFTAGGGSPTLAWTYSGGGARLEGGEIVVVWIKGQNPGDFVRDTATNAVTGSSDVTAGATSEATDLVLAFGSSFNAGTPNLLALTGGSTLVDDVTVNAHEYDVYQATAQAGTTTVQMDTSEYGAIAVIALKDTA